MATQDYAASVQGVAIRVTRLNANGTLSTTAGDSITTSKFIRVSFTPEYEDGDEITEKAADGTVCVSFKAPDTLKRVNLEVAICEPDPELTALLSGGLLLADEDGLAVGWSSAQVGEDPSGNGVAVEVWSRAIQSGKPSITYPYFHWIFPYVKTRQSGDRVIENGLLANTFEGYGLGNMAFGRGIDGRWSWPQADDRPYSYARSVWAPVSQQGNYTWDSDTGQSTLVTSITDPTPPPDVNIPKDVGATVAVATGMPSGNTRPPVDTGEPTDIVYGAELSATVLEQDGSTDVVTMSAAQPGDIFPANDEITAQDASNAAKLAGLGFVASPLTAWTTGQKITIGSYFFHWSGSAWAAAAAS